MQLFGQIRHEISTKEMPQKYLIRSFLLLDYYKKFAKREEL
jgi:hypothetical protein